MKRLLVLGGGTAGTMVVNKLRRRLDRAQWRITVVDQDDEHHYQPGLLFIPFGGYRPDESSNPGNASSPTASSSCSARSTGSTRTQTRVALVDGRTLPYDYLVIATGDDAAAGPDTGHARGPSGGDSIFDFYTLEGARRCATALRRFDRRPARRAHHRDADQVPGRPAGVRLPRRRVLRASAGIRDRVEIVYVTPLPGAFTKPIASAAAGRDARRAQDPRRDRLHGRAHRRRAPRRWSPTTSARCPFDLLVTVPLNMGADFVARSGLGDELNYVPVDKHTLLSTAYDNIFAVGDASNIPASKAGSVAHFSVEVFVDNFLEHVAGRADDRLASTGTPTASSSPATARRCCIDFNYDTEPLPGTYPLPGVGPLEPAQGDPRQPPRASSRSAGSTGTSCCPAARSRCRRTCRWPASTTPTRPDQQGGATMPVTTIDGHAGPRQRRGLPHRRTTSGTRTSAEPLAAQIGIELTDEHWKAIRFLREDFADAGRDRRPCAGSAPSAASRSRQLFDALPAEAGQEDGLHRRPAQAARLRVTRPQETTP